MRERWKKKGEGVVLVMMGGGEPFLELITSRMEAFLGQKGEAKLGAASSFQKLPFRKIVFRGSFPPRKLDPIFSPKSEEVSTSSNFAPSSPKFSAWEDED